jgi:putative spermidine/putrescine transport system substrate-binding protein
MNKRRVMIVMLIVVFAMSSVLWAAGQQESAAPFESRYQSMSWDEIVAEASGQTVYHYMWGGSDSINNWVSGFYANRLMDKYNITLEMVPVTGPQVYINKVLGEKQAGKNTGGSVDLVWVNGENFRTMRQGDLLFGPYSDLLPNTKYVNMEDQAIAYDFGYPVEGYESPYGAAQMVMIYDSARVPNPPKTVEALIAFIKANPGKFTYPAPPDFTGSAFIRHLFYYVNGGTDGLMGPFDEAKYQEVAAKFFALLNELKPYMWRQGTTFPENLPKLNDLFANGEVLFSFNYGPGDAAAKIKSGQFPQTVRTFVFDEGTIANSNYLAIPYNSSAKAAAMVAANEMLDPAVQYSMAVERNAWPLITNVSLMPAEWQDKINSIERHPSILSGEELSNHTLPEMMADWLIRIEADWMRLVLQK